MAHFWNCAKTAPLNEINAPAWRQLIKDTVRAVITQPDADAVALVEQLVGAAVPSDQQAALRGLILDELRRMHEGVLARYGLRPSQWFTWRDKHQQG